MAVAAYVLRICRQMLAALDYALQQRRAVRQPYGPYLKPAEQILTDARFAADEEFLDEVQLLALADLLDGAGDDNDLALRARDIATMLDQLRGNHFFSWFAGRRLDITPGTPFPIHEADVVVEEMGTKRGLPPPPDSTDAPLALSVPLDGTSRLRLAPADAGRFAVVLDARHHGVVDGLFSGDRPAAPGPDVTWAAAIPSCAIMSDLTWDTIDDVKPPGFYRVRPKAASADAYRARVLKTLDVAANEGATIITLPELSTDEILEEQIAHWFAAHPRVALLVAGSRHLEGGPKRNRARVFMRGVAASEAMIHDKFSSFSIPLDVVREELIDRPNIISIISGRRWSFCPLICKDFMETIPRRILVDLRVRAVIVASMSPKTDLYVTSAKAMAQDGQALVFVSNAPHGPTDDIAILAQPRRAPTPKTSEQQPLGIVALIATNGPSFRVVSLA